jgi:hypothetical protein
MRDQLHIKEKEAHPDSQPRREKSNMLGQDVLVYWKWKVFEQYL